MSGFETASITVAYRSRCEDRVAIIEDGERVVIGVADGRWHQCRRSGCGRRPSGDDRFGPHSSRDQDSCCSLLRQIDYRVGVGESTGVVLAVSPDGIYGASVGDSEAWLIHGGELIDLTRDQVRKPLLGSGASEPVGFSRDSYRGMLIVATDGFCKNVNRETLFREILWIDFSILPRKLVEMVRLPSGGVVGRYWHRCLQTPSCHGTAKTLRHSPHRRINNGHLIANAGRRPESLPGLWASLPS